MNKILFLFFIIFLEGYVVLSGELLAIRQTIPYIGSGTDTVSIIIASVLMPLAFGYYAGGQYKKKNRGSVRKKLLSNILTSLFFFIFGLSYVFIELFFNMMSNIGITDRLAQATIYSIVFLVVPVYLLAQTIPLVSHYFRKEQLSQITGKMLFYSTTGSFMGAVFSTLFLMAVIGVHHTAVVTIGCLCLLYILLAQKKISGATILVILLFCMTVLLNNNTVMKSYHVVENNQYNTIRVIEKNNGMTRHLSLNNNKSSLYSEVPIQFGDDPTPGHTFKYVDHINKHFIDPLMFKDRAYDILVIGAAGFTIGLTDDKNNYTFIDIDKSVKEISEEHFLKKKLTPNKKFEASPARAFLYQSIQGSKKYDLIILDAFLGAKTIPEHMVTKEFFESIKKVMKPNGIMVGNFIISASFSSAFSIKLDNTLREVYPFLTRQIISDYNAWDRNDINQSNLLYVYHHRKTQIDSYYTDNKNTIHFDKTRAVE
jgi:hypothetical protein